MRRGARAVATAAPGVAAVLAAGLAAAVVLAAGAPGALAALAATSSRSTAPAHTTTNVPPPLTATPGAPVSLSGCLSPPNRPAHSLHGEPWPQQTLDFSRVWGITQGKGVTVAVVDSGVDYTSQLGGRVSYKDLTGSGPVDCVGHGTAVASIIAASDRRTHGIPFYGVAPAAKILSIKVNNGENGNAGLLPESTTVAVCVIVGWLLVWTVLGAWRMMTRDA